jgi:hypothetical protein
MYEITYNFKIWEMEIKAVLQQLGCLMNEHVLGMMWDTKNI